LDIFVNFDNLMIAPTLKSVATTIDQETLAEIERIANETGLKTADLLRIGLRKLIAAYEATGKIELGPATTEREVA